MVRIDAPFALTCDNNGDTRDNNGDACYNNGDHEFLEKKDRVVRIVQAQQGIEL